MQRWNNGTPVHAVSLLVTFVIRTSLQNISALLRLALRRFDHERNARCAVGSLQTLVSHEIWPLSSSASKRDTIIMTLCNRGFIGIFECIPLQEQSINCKRTRNKRNFIFYPKVIKPTKGSCARSRPIYWQSSCNIASSPEYKGHFNGLLHWTMLSFSCRDHKRLGNLIYLANLQCTLDTHYVLKWS